MDHIILGICWTLWCFIHSFLASPGIKRSVIHTLRIIPQWYRLFYNFLAIAGFFGIAFFQSRLQDDLFMSTNLLIKAGGETIFILGVIFILFSLREYNLKAFAGLSSEDRDKKLVISGLNKYIRHPLYFATIMMILGWFMMRPTNTNLIACGILITYTFVGAWIEEKKLITDFGSDYEKYRSETGMWLPKLMRVKDGNK